MIAVPRIRILPANTSRSKTIATTTATKAAAKTVAKKRAPNAGFAKPMTLSPALAAVIGAGPAPRTEVTKKIWDYIKAHNLQDATKRTLINADDALFAVFDKRQVTMFEMTKLVNAHLS
jgi:upstream activation factor subunit UAF30